VRSIGLKLARLTVAGALCGIVGIAAIYGAWRFACPYVAEFTTRREVAALDRRVSELQAEHRRLEQQAKLLATPEGIKIEARRLGLLEPGERSLRFMTRPQPRDAPPTQPPAPPGVLERLRAWGRRLVAEPHGPGQLAGPLRGRHLPLGWRCHPNGMAEPPARGLGTQRETGTVPSAADH
jgi:cell division protein FtsL